MQDKQKVTLYIPPELHRQLKIRSAIDTESMSTMVEKAIAFYLKYPEKVQETEESYGSTHQVHICPECDAAMVVRNGKMVSLRKSESVVYEELPLEVREKVASETNSQGEEELIPCY